MKTDLKKVFAIAGYPGLYVYVSNGKNSIIVESLLDKKRMSAGNSMRVTSLSDVAIYTDAEELALREVLEKIKEKENGMLAIPHKSPTSELQKYFEVVLPDYDRERFYTSHMKKVLEWYNTLQQNNMLEFEPIEDEALPDEEEK